MTEEEVNALQDELASSKKAVASLETEKQALTGELETLKGELEAKGTRDTLREEIGGLEAAVAEREAKLGEVQGQLTALTESVAGKDEKLRAAGAGEDALREEIGGLMAKLEAATGGLASAVQSYRALVLEANPAVPGELITGESIEEISGSLEKAKSIVGKVKEGLAAEAKAVTVPAGAPARTEPDLSSLSSTEKIKYAIARNNK